MFDHRFKACTLLALVAGPSHSFTTPWSSRRTGIATRQSDLILSYSNEKGSALTESFGFLSLAELRHILSERGVHFRESMGKRELMEILRGSQSSKVESDFDTPLQSFYSQEQSLVSTFKTVSPSVANIKVEAGPQQQQQMGPPGMEMPSAGTGSGFLWDTMGHVVTNFHVISGGIIDGPMPTKVQVKLTGLDKSMDADIVAVEPEKDLAVLRLRNFDPRNSPAPIPIGRSSDLQVGQSVLAIGNPFGLDDTLTTGIISALGRNIDGIAGRPISGCIQTDAAINPGNSGGPLLDSHGRLIGINTSIFNPNGQPGNIGIGFAIPVDTIRKVVKTLMQYGTVSRPTLGISIVDEKVTKNIGAKLRIDLDGCLVGDIVPNSPATLAGLEGSSHGPNGNIHLGDLVTHINGEQVHDSEELLTAVEEMSEGETVSLRVLRGCDPTRAEVVPVLLTSTDRLQRRPQNILQVNMPPRGPRGGAPQQRMQHNPSMWRGPPPFQGMPPPPRNQHGPPHQGPPPLMNGPMNGPPQPMNGPPQYGPPPPMNGPPPPLNWR